MSLRIELQDDPAGTTLRVSGLLVGPYVAELERAFEQAAGSGDVPAVDISDMSFAAAAGIAALRGFLARGADVRGCPAFLAPQLFGEVVHE